MSEENKATSYGPEVARLGPLYATVERHADRVFLDIWHRDEDEGLLTVRFDLDEGPEGPLYSVALACTAVTGDEAQTVYEQTPPIRGRVPFVDFEENDR